MAGIIPDYEYDIFISYGQKDNKGDKWEIDSNNRIVENKNYCYLYSSCL